MAVENISTINLTTPNKAIPSVEQANSALISKAVQLGISVEEFYIYDEEGNISSIDTQKLNAAINEAISAQSKNNNIPESKDDEFVKTGTVDKTLTDKEEKEKVKESKTTIDKEYNDAVNMYLPSINMDAAIGTQENQIADKWTDIRETARKLTGVDVSNATVLDGVKDFVNSLTNLVNETKSYIATKNSDEAKESFFSAKTIADIQNEQNNIQTYESRQNENPFVNNPFFNSAFKSFAPEEEEETAVDCE